MDGLLFLSKWVGNSTLDSLYISSNSVNRLAQHTKQFWTCRILDLNIYFDFSTAPACRKQQQIFNIENSKFDISTNWWADEDISKFKECLGDLVIFLWPLFRIYELYLVWVVWTTRVVSCISWWERETHFIWEKPIHHDAFQWQWTVS